MPRLLKVTAVAGLFSLGASVHAEQLPQPVAPTLPASEAVPPVEVQDALTRSEAFQRWIDARVTATVVSLEYTRRVMLLCRSPKLDKSRPAYLQPPVIKATEIMVPFVRERDAMGAGSSKAVMRGISRDWLLASYPEAALDELRAALRSPSGMRVQQILEARWAILIVAESMTDVSTGLGWSWPAGRLRSYMQEVGRLAQFNAALNAASPGAADVISLVSGRMDEELPDEAQEKIDRMNWNEVVKAFDSGVSERDFESIKTPAGVAIGRFNDTQARMAQARMQLFAPAMGAWKTLHERSREACSFVAGKPCSEDLVERTASASGAVLRLDDFKPFSARLQSLPESGCAP